ncbi:unnamed protein product, partial [Rotaria sp. Silwood2]
DERGMTSGFHQALCLTFETTHTDRPLRYRVKGFGKSTNQLTFDLRSDKDQTTTFKSENELTLDDFNKDQSTIILKKSISVAKYLAKKYKPLEYPDPPCIVEWERDLRPLDSFQRGLCLKNNNC